MFVRAIGETSACCMQAMSGLVRYMTHAHRREWIEATLSLVARDKMSTLVDLLNNRHKSMLVLIGEWGM